MVQHTANRTSSRHSKKKIFHKLPHNVTKQLEKIYFKSLRNVKKRPYQFGSGLLLSLGVYFLTRFFKKK